MNVVTIVMSRDCVMLLMRDIDPESVHQCATRRLKRRVYSSKVILLLGLCCSLQELLLIPTVRVLISRGTLTSMINFLPLDFVSMAT